MAVYVAFLRAINVSGTNTVKMAALKELHEAAGHTAIKTYLQTGNVIFESDEPDPAALTARLKKDFQQKLGFATEIFVRTGPEILEIAGRNPFLNQPDRDKKWMVVMFLAQAPTEEAKNGLLEAYQGPEEIIFSGKEVFIYYPNGIGNSKLTNAYLEKKLKTSGTARNWNTVSEVLKLTGLPVE